MFFLWSLSDYKFPLITRTLLSILSDLINAVVRTVSALPPISNSARPRGCPRGVMVKVLDCGIVVSEFELQSRYHVRFRTNTFGKSLNPLILPAMG